METLPLEILLYIASTNIEVWRGMLVVSAFGRASAGLQAFAEKRFRWVCTQHTFRGGYEPAIVKIYVHRLGNQRRADADGTIKKTRKCNFRDRFSDAPFEKLRDYMTFEHEMWSFLERDALRVVAEEDIARHKLMDLYNSCNGIFDTECFEFYFVEISTKNWAVNPTRRVETVLDLRRGGWRLKLKYVCDAYSLKIKVKQTDTCGYKKVYNDGVTPTKKNKLYNISSYELACGPQLQ